jgi:hypothetical protein
LDILFISSILRSFIYDLNMIFILYDNMINMSIFILYDNMINMS